jgi:hypothetical protein|tara:strand:- start:1440 stop:1619 length:180 start_codon:yes stop_codon:yes gene_type:complete
MKLWITEFIDTIDGSSIGPYIKADTVAQANRIAIQYGLLVLGEIQELQHDEPIQKRMIH